MAIQKRVGASGKPKYTVVVTIPDGYRMGVPNLQRASGQREAVGTFATRKAAEAAEGDAKAMIQRGEYIPKAVRLATKVAEAPRVWTVEDVVNRWLAGRRATVTANSLSQYEAVARLHLIPAIGNRDVVTITRTDVRDMVREWQTRPRFGAQLQNRTLLVLRGAMDECVEDGLIPANPATNIKLPSPKKRADVTPWTGAQLRRFLTEAEHDDLGVFWWFLAVEGMRRGEGLGVRWSDVVWSPDESGATVSVHQTVVGSIADGGKALIQGRAKTRSSQRAVQLTSATVAALKRHRDTQRFRRQQAGETWVDHGLIVCDAFGGPVRPDSVTRRLVHVIQAAAVPDLGVHKLRHGAISSMLKAGVPIATVAMKAGHADVGLTFGTYGHLVPADQQAASDAMQALLDAPTGTNE